MRRLSVPLVLVLGLLLAACAGGTPAPGSSASSAPTTNLTPTDEATPTPDPPGPLAGFELSGSALIAVDADGDQIASYPLSDARGMIDALTGFLGTPSDGPAGDGCDVNVAVWPPSVGDVVIAYSPGGAGTPIVVVKSGSVGIQPSAGPAFGENGTAFGASLPAGYYEAGIAYVYDSVGGAYGGVAFLDASGNVASLASPSPPYGTGFC